MCACVYVFILCMCKCDHVCVYIVYICVCIRTHTPTRARTMYSTHTYIIIIIIIHTCVLYRGARRLQAAVLCQPQHNTPNWNFEDIKDIPQWMNNAYLMTVLEKHTDTCTPEHQRRLHKYNIYLPTSCGSGDPLSLDKRALAMAKIKRI